MKNLLIAITLGLTLTACGGGDTPPEKQMTQKEIVAAAVAGDKDAMRELERQVAKKAKAEKKKMVSAAKDGDPLALFQKALMSGGGNQERVNTLADAGNPNAQLWNAVSNRQASDLSDTDKQEYRTHMVAIAASGDKYKYSTVANAAYPLSAEAAFQISEDKLHSKWLFDTDTQGAIKYLKQAANEGHHGAMFKLATRYQYGHDMDKDLNAAKSWLEKSAIAGNRAAKDALKNWKK